MRWPGVVREREERRGWRQYIITAQVLPLHHPDAHYPGPAPRGFVNNTLPPPTSYKPSPDIYSFTSFALINQYGEPDTTWIRPPGDISL